MNIMSFMDIKHVKQLQELDLHHKMGKNIFVLIYMNGCEPCRQTKPEWEKLKNQYQHITIAQIDKDILPPANSNHTFCLDVDGFPTIRHYHKNKKEEYKKIERNVKDFKKWIKKQLTTGGKTKRKKRTLKKLI